MSLQLKLPQRTFVVLVLALLVADCALGFLAIRRATSLTDFLFFHIGVLGLMLCPLLASYYLLRPQATNALRLRALLVFLQFLLALALLFGAIDSNPLRELLEVIQRRFRHPSWQLLGLTLAAAVYLPLIVHRVRQKLRKRQFADLAVGSAFMLFLLFLYLPFGFNSIGHWESWGYRAYLEGQHSWNVEFELNTRFWVMVPHLLANIIAPDSFVGFHLVHLLILWAKLTLLFGILRALGFTRPHAFLTTMLFMVYPVNSDLMSLRSLPNQFSVMSLLAAAFLMLEYRKSPSRWHLLGIWLGLLFNVVTNETAYAIILVAPALWVSRRPRGGWQNANLTVVWYLFPACKIAHLLLLSSLNMTFYNSYVFESSKYSFGISADALGAVFGRLAEVYRHTFVGSWVEALNATGASNWFAPSLAMLTLAGAFTWYLVRCGDSDEQEVEDNAKTSFVCGLLFVVPAVGILIWLPQYAGDLWRMYFYVPIGASIAVFSLARIFTGRVLPRRYREATIVALCLALMLPATERLLIQHDSAVRRADNKARMLYQLMRTIPRIKDDTVILLTTDMTKEELAASAISELRYSNDLDNSMLYVLYGNGSPIQSTFCVDKAECRTFGGEKTIFTSDSSELLQRTLAINIAADMSVALLEHPVDYFGLDSRFPYDASLLYDRDAEISSRARSMLASARRAETNR
ncbi:MAG: hypothetical protein OXG60_13140 [Chloroflexi bacterium]|nr:hypothetical protein [Chloroflexota bacterium]